MQTRSVSLVSIAALILAANARAGGVRIVDPAFSGVSYENPQSAIAAAPDGAALLIAAGTYPGFAISGKSISLFAMPDATVNLSSPVSVTGLTASQSVVLSGLRVTCGASNDMSPAIQVANCEGSVRVEGSTFHAYDRDFGFCFSGTGWILPGSPGATVVSSSRVVFSACAMTGGKGDSVDETDDSCVCGEGDGGAGLQVSGGSSRVVLQDCSLYGGPGGGAEGCQGHGGDALSVAGGSVFASACTFTGGYGGPTWYPPPACGGPGGDGVALLASTSFRSIGSTSTGGTGGCGQIGLPYTGPLPILVPGPAARATFSPLVSSELGPLSIAFQGGGLDAVLLTHGLRNPRGLTFGSRGPVLVKGDPFQPLLELGTANGSGAFTTQVLTPSLPAGSSSLRPILQVASANTHGFTPGSSASLLVLDRQSEPDCDGNGLNDFVQLIENPSLDANQNLIPDACPGG